MVGDANGPCLVPCAPFSAPEASCSHVQQHRQPDTPPSISLTCDTELEVNMLPNWHLEVSTWRQLQTEKSSIMSNIFLGNQPALSVVQAWKAGQGGHQEEPLSLLLYNLNLTDIPTVPKLGSSTRLLSISFSKIFYKHINTAII